MKESSWVFCTWSLKYGFHHSFLENNIGNKADYFSRSNQEDNQTSVDSTFDILGSLLPRYRILETSASYLFTVEILPLSIRLKPNFRN